MKVAYTKEFIKEFKRLPKDIQILAEQKELLFIQDPYNHQLRTHRLKGKLDGYLAFSINFRYRIVFRFGSDGIVYFLSIGGHEIYK